MRGDSFELVARSVRVGRPGDESVCSHDHHAGGDDCLSFHLAPERVDALGEAGLAFAARFVSVASGRERRAPPQYLVRSRLRRAATGDRRVFRDRLARAL